MQNAPSSANRYREILGCCCLAPAVFGLILLGGGVIAFFLLKGTLEAVLPVLAYQALEYIVRLGASFLRGFLGS